MRIILASASPRRRELIKKIPSLDVEVIPSDADENICESNKENYVKTLATLKAKAVFNKYGGNVVGADTVVVINDEILGKPKDEADARATFLKLCGKTHEVLTGIALVNENGVYSDFEVTKVTFNDFDEKLVKAYIETKSPFDKAGGYGIQDELLKPLIRGIDGDLDNVIGLPVEKLKQMLVFFSKSE